MEIVQNEACNDVTLPHELAPNFDTRHHITMLSLMLNLKLLLVHYVDIVLDFILAYLYYTNKSSQMQQYSYMTLLFLMLPNILLFICFIFYEILKKSQPKTFQKMVILFAINFSHIEVFICHLVWYQTYSLLKKSKSRSSELSNQLVQFDFIILIANMFHALFNNYPQIMLQSLIFIDSVANSNLLKSSSSAIIVAKVILSLYRVSFTSTYFISYMLSAEFNINLNKNIFLLFRFVSNLIFILARVFPLILMLNLFTGLGLLFIGARFFINFLITYYFVTKFDNERLNLNSYGRDVTSMFCLTPSRFNSLRLFWTFFLSIFRITAHFDDVDGKNFYYLINTFINFVENVFFVVFIYANFVANLYFYFMFAVLFGFWTSTLIEILYWKLVFKSTANKNAFIVKKFKTWLLDQTKATLKGVQNEEEKFYSEEERNTFLSSSIA